MELASSFLFSVEYICRLLSVKRYYCYMISFGGIIDLASSIPALFGLLAPDLFNLMVFRLLKLVRLLRLFKMIQFMKVFSEMSTNFGRNVRKMIVFVSGFFCVAVVFGGIMHVVEEEQFDSIPIATYWAIVTMTHTGYGDLSPNTSGGQAVAAIIMAFSYTVVVIGLSNRVRDNETGSGSQDLPLRSSCGGSYRGVPSEVQCSPLTTASSSPLSTDVGIPSEMESSIKPRSEIMDEQRSMDSDEERHTA